MQFEHEALGQRVLFGAGRAPENVRVETERLSARRAMLIASPRYEILASRLAEQLPNVLRWSEVRQHVPVESADRARVAAAEAGVDVVVAVGGGSATGLAKAIALTHPNGAGMPIIAVPTTYSGSEATHMWGIAEAGTKRTGLDKRVLPTAVVYDAELTLSLPRELAMASGLNALAHAVDGLWAPKADPINRALGLEGARALAASLPRIAADAGDIGAREQALYGSYLSAVAFASAGSGLHHKVCHVLGGTFDLPHAVTHATVLPYVLAFNAGAVPELAGRLAAMLREAPEPGRSRESEEDGAAAATAALNRLREAVGAPDRIADARFTLADVPEAVRRIVAAAPPSNPVPVTEENITALLMDILAGNVPTQPYNHRPAMVPAN